MESSLVCNATESLFQINFTLSQAAFNSNFGEKAWGLFPSSSSRPFINESFETFEDINDVGLCLPLEACYRAEVDRGFQEGDYSLLWNGEEVPKGPLYMFFDEPWDYDYYYSEFGACVPNCTVEESLFELEMVTNGDNPVWSLTRDDNTTALMECQEGRFGDCNGKFSVLNFRTCFQKDSCHRLLVGDFLRSLFDDSTQEDAVYTLKVDGKLVRSNHEFFFDEVEVGTCPVSQCSESEELLEIRLQQYIYDDTPSWVPLLHWKLTEAYNRSLIFEGEQDTERQNGIFAIKQCVPKIGCYQLDLFVPEVDLNVIGEDYRAYSELIPYEIWLGGRVYSSKLLRFRSKLKDEPDDPDWEEIYSYSFHLGNGCTVDAICDPVKESLFELQLRIPSIDEPCSNSVALLPCVFSWDLVFDWSADYNDRQANETPFYVRGDDFFDYGYNANTTYAAFACVPEDDCFLFMTWGDIAESVVKNYTISRNGEPIEAPRQFHDDGFYSGYTTTAYGGPECPNGGVASIHVLGSIVGLVIAIVLLLL